MNRLHLPFFALLALAAGCSSSSGGSSPNDGTAPEPTALATTAVTWNSANVDVGTVQAVTEQDMSVLVFGTRGVSTLAAGSLVRSDETVTAWTSAAMVSSPDGVSTWTVGIDTEGHVQRILPEDPPQDVSDRYGLAATDKVLGAAGTSGPVVFQLDGSVAIGDGANLTRYPLASRAVSANGTKVAVADGSAVRVFDQGKEMDIALPDAQLVAYDSAGDLLVATSHALFKLNGTVPTKVYDAGSRTIHQLVGAGAAAWLAVDGDLAQWKDNAVALGSGGTLAADAHLVGSASGDVWAISGGQLFRFSAGGAPAGGADETTWNTTVQPVYAAVCSNCHSPPGSGKDSSHIDLSSYAAWTARKATVYTRVVTNAGTPAQMPPPGSGFTLAPDQLAIIQAWAKP